MLGRIWRKIWQRIRSLWQQGLRRQQPIVPPEPELPPLSDTGYEQLLFQLLDGVAAGWQQQQVISHLNKRETDRFFRSWLQRFGQQLLESPQPNRQLAHRMVQLAESVGAKHLGDNLLHPTQKFPTNASPPDDINTSPTSPPSHPSTHTRTLQTLTHQIHEIGRQLLARELPPLPEAEYEPMFQRLLAEAAQGEAAVLAFLTDLSPRVTVAQWEAWLQGYGERLLAEAEPNQQIARGMIRLGELLADSPSTPNYQLSTITSQLLDFGRAMRAREVVWEVWEYEERVEEVGDAEGWWEEGNRLFVQGDFQGAVAAHDKVLEFKPNLPDTWNTRGVALERLGRYEETIAACDKALEFKPDYYLAWNTRGVALEKLGRYEEAILSYDKSIEFKFDYYSPWNGRSLALQKLGRYEEMLASCDKFIEFNPDYYVAWNNRGVALEKLGRYEEAILSYDKSIEFKPDDYYLAWHNRGVAVGKLSHPIQKPSPLIKQNPQLNQPGYPGQIANYKEGLKHCPADTHPEGWGYLQHRMGQAHYFWGKQPNERNPRQCFIQARDCYAAALHALTEERFKELHLKVVRDLVKVLLSLGEPETAEDWKLHGLRVLRNLINQTPSPTVQNRLEDEFASFRQWQVDRLVRKNEFQLALETAERDKNRRLGWILSRRLEIAATESKSACADSRNSQSAQADFAPVDAASTAQSSINSQSAQADFVPVDAVSTAYSPLFSPNTAAILYWHKSSDKLTTFILEPGAASPRAVVADAAAVDEWIGEWDRLYRDYGTKGKSRAGKEEHPWRGEMPKRLEELERILGVAEILEEMEEGNSRIEDGDFQSRLQGQNPPSRIGENVDTHSRQLNSRSELNQPAQAGFDSVAANSIRRNYLILIPHRELHRLPLHALFRDYCCTYLPSLQMGLDLSQPVSDNFSGILSIEHPHHEGLSGLLAAEMESHLLRQMFAQQMEAGGGNSRIEDGEWNSRLQGQNPPARIDAEGDTHPQQPNSLRELNQPAQAGFDSVAANSIRREISATGIRQGQYIPTDAATRDAVIAALQQPHRYLHFNGHASHEKNPADSALYLFGTDMLTVADIRKLNLQGYELAVLSGCETGITNLETVDAEYVGLASAFLKAGVRQVVSTLWTVQSDASALLMLYFYRKVLKGCPPSLALVKAVKWLRGLTNAKLERLYRWMLRRVSSRDKLATWLNTELLKLERMEVQEKKTRKFDMPYFWAAFAITDLREDLC